MQKKKSNPKHYKPHIASSKNQKSSNIKTNHPTMTTTRAIAQGIPRRVYATKAKAKPRVNKTTTTKNRQTRKRPASDNSEESEEDEDGSSSDEPVRVVKKKRAKRQRVEESEGEVELIETDAEPPDKEVENVDDGGGEEPPDEQEVSIKHTR